MPKPKQLTAVLSHDGITWHATIKGDRSARAAGHSTRTARTAISHVAREKYGEGVELAFVVELPEELQRKIDAWKAEEKAIAEATRRHLDQRAELALEMLSTRVTQSEAASVFGMTQNTLNVMLKRHATGRPITKMARKKRKTR